MRLVNDLQLAKEIVPSRRVNGRIRRICLATVDSDLETSLDMIDKSMEEVADLAVGVGKLKVEVQLA